MSTPSYVGGSAATRGHSSSEVESLSRLLDRYFSSQSLRPDLMLPVGKLARELSQGNESAARSLLEEDASLVSGRLQVLYPLFQFLRRVFFACVRA